MRESSFGVQQMTVKTETKTVGHFIVQRIANNVALTDFKTP